MSSLTFSVSSFFEEPPQPEALFFAFDGLSVPAVRPAPSSRSLTDDGKMGFGWRAATDLRCVARGPPLSRPTASAPWADWSARDSPSARAWAAIRPFRVRDDRVWGSEGTQHGLGGLFGGEAGHALVGAQGAAALKAGTARQLMPEYGVL